ncbi:MAG: FtsH protease activity modulator HflK [Desulfatibacillaceae bacterium]
MPWDWDKLKQQQDQRNPPGGGGGQGNGPGGVPPQMDEIFNKFRNTKLPGFGLGILILVIIAVILGFSSFYTVDQNAVGVVQRFGKYVRETPPGLHLKFPYGIEKVTTVPIHNVFQEEFLDRPGMSGASFGEDSETQNEALMLTGDLNVAVVPWIVQYKVKEPTNFLFNVADVDATLRDLSESTMRLVVGDRSINEVISNRSEIAAKARELLQTELDEAEIGIQVTTIELKKTNVPQPVQPSFNEVNQAIQEKEKLIYQAKEERNRVIPAARGEAKRTIAAAEGYAMNRVNRAEGDSNRFTSLYGEYSKAPEVTRRRLYLESLADVLPKLGDKYIIDSDSQNVLPLLNLNKNNGGGK